MYAHYLHTIDPGLIMKTTERHFPLQSSLSRHAWRYRGFSGSLVTGTRDRNPVTSRLVPMVVGDTADATCDWISFLDDVQSATAARTVRRS